MNPVLVYACVPAGIFSALLLRRLLYFISALIQSDIVTKWSFSLLQSISLRQISTPSSISRQDAITQFLYWAGTVLYNTIGIKNVLQASTRAGTLTTFNLIPLLLGDRLDFVAQLLDLSRRTVGILHTSVGVMTFVQMTLHLALQIASQKLHINRLIDVCVIAAAVALFFMLTTAIPICRRVMYECFLATHNILALVLTLCLWKYSATLSPSNGRFLICASCTYLSTLVLRLGRLIYRNFQRRGSGWQLGGPAGVQAKENVLVLTLPLPRSFRIRAGQYVYLWFWAPRSLGLLSAFQRHPFVIASWTENEVGDAVAISILVKPEQGLTKRLRLYPSLNENLTTAVDGPYGGGLRTDRTGTLILFATDIGIAAQMSAIRATLGDHIRGRTSIRRISLIWQIALERQEAWVADWMQEMLALDQNIMMLHATLYVLDGFDDSEVPYGHSKIYGRRVTKYYQQADLGEVVQREMQAAIGRPLVAVSAHAQFRDQLKMACMGLEKTFDYQEMDFQPKINPLESAA